MSKKQKKVLVRIIVALVLLAGVILLDKLALLPQWDRSVFGAVSCDRLRYSLESA